MTIKKMRIAILIPSTFGGGAERLILDQIRYHDPSRVSLHVIAMRKGNMEDEFQEIARRNNVTYVNLDQRRNYPLIASQVLKYLRKNKIDILHTHLIESDFCGILCKLLLPIKWVISKHNTDSFRKGFIGIIDGMISCKADAIICVSKSVKKFFHTFEHIPNTRMEVIYNGVDLMKFSVSREDARASLGCTRAEFAIGILGRLDRQKGHEFLIRAFAKLEKKMPRAKLYIFGEGPLRRHLEDISIKENSHNVLFLGYVANVEYYLPGLDLCVLPSLFEGFGLVIVEAMASGVLVIASNIDGITEIIEDGKNGILVMPGNEEELYKKLMWVISNPKKAFAMVRRAKERAKDFEIKKNIASLEQVYRKCAE